MCSVCVCMCVCVRACVCVSVCVRVCVCNTMLLSHYHIIIGSKKSLSDEVCVPVLLGNHMIHVSLGCSVTRLSNEVKRVTPICQVYTV